MTKSATDKIEDLRENGNNCVKAGNYAESVLHYSHAIKLSPSVPQLYSNRSFSFLKLQHYYFALEDAKEAIKLDPTWGKAYFRKGEVEYATEHYAEALMSYNLACQLMPNLFLFECIQRTKKALDKQTKFDKKIPWVGAGMGIMLGVLLVLADATLPKSSVFKHPVIQVLVVIAISLLGLGLGKCYKWYMLSQRRSLIEPPPVLDPKDSNSRNQNEEDVSTTTTSSNHENKRTHPRYTKAQARQRYKKGKS